GYTRQPPCQEQKSFLTENSQRIYAYRSLHHRRRWPSNRRENIEVDPPRRLVQSFRALWSDEVKSEGTSRVTWEIEQIADSCRLVVTHDQLREGANDQIYGGWPMILSGLKTWLESGELLTTPGSLMYSQDWNA